jgi:hypothetical protein
MKEDIVYEQEMETPADWVDVELARDENGVIIAIQGDEKYVTD